MESIYNNILELPLFKGVSRERIIEAMGTTPFHFLKFSPGETIIEAGSPCTHIVFIISGSARVTVSNHNDRFTVSQTLSGPDVIAPEFLFGRSTAFPCNAVAIDQVGILQIEKADYLRIISSDKIFMFNLLNILSMKAQKGFDGILSLASGSLEERLAYWIIALTQHTGKDITLACRQRDLNVLFGVQRSSFIAMLDDMKERGIIDYEPGLIRILSRRALAELLSSYSATD